MTGKVSLLLVMGFSLIFLIFGHSYNTASNGAVDNFAEYYYETVTHDLANSGANIAANGIFKNKNYDESDGNFPFELNGGEVDVDVRKDGLNTIITSVATVTHFDATYVDTVRVILGPTSFSKYAYYSESEGNNIWWTSKDTVYGPFHTQGNLLAEDHPVFGYKGFRTTIKGKVVYHDYYVKYGINEPTKWSSNTQKQTYNTSKAQDKPKFYGSFEDGVDEPLNLTGLQTLRDNADANGLKIDSTTIVKTVQVWDCDHGGTQHTTDCGDGEWDDVVKEVPATVFVTFIKDSVRIQVEGHAPTTYVSEDIAPNGIIYAEGMNIELKGTVEGRYSVVSDGDVFLADDIVYNSDPRENPASRDVLGIIANQNVYVKDDNATKDIKIHGSIYCQNGGFGAENYQTRSVDGTINLFGGIVQKIRRAVGQFNSTTNMTTSGFNKSYRYDPRFETTSPPSFPTTKGFHIIAWIEGNPFKID